MVEYEHHEIHSGSHYLIRDIVNLSINNVHDVQFTTPNTTKWSHLVFTIDTESETEWFVYEGVTVNLAGTAITPINNNRNSTNTSGNTIAVITNGSIADANTDTTVSGATEIEHGICGDGKTGGSGGRDREFILKQNTKYCFRVVATAAGYINFAISWYEHTNK